MAKVGETEMNGPAYGDADSKLTEDSKCHSKVSSRCPEFCQLIGRRETKTIELSKRERDLRRRLEMLECWMPAVTMMRMMTRDVKADDITRVIDKQAATMTVSCLCPNSRLSQHRDVRIREVEGKRKKAQRRLEEARKLLDEKQTAVEEQTERIEEARRKRVKLEERVKELEAKISCSNGLGKAASAESVVSIGPDELMYLTKLEELVKSEAASKRQLEELEKRQEMYVKALETASQIWSEEERHEKVDGLKSQLEVKASANQQLAERICQLEDQVETLKSKLITCNDKLKTYTERKSVEAIIGTEQSYRDMELSAVPDFKEVSVIYDSAEFTIDEGVDATVPTEARETSAIVEVTERAVQEVIRAPEHEDAETTTEQELRFVSLEESIWKGESPSSPLIYDSLVHELETKSRTTKFDMQTQTTVNYVCIEIPEMVVWGTNIGKVRRVILECDTCSSTDPEILMIQEGINRRLEREFVVSDNQDSLTRLDKVPSAESRAVYEEQLGPVSSLMTRRLEDWKKSSEILLSGGIGGVNRAGLSTPPVSFVPPVSMSTPTPHAVKKVSRTSLAIPGAMITPMAQVMEEVSGEGADRYGVSPQPSSLTTPASEMMKRVSITSEVNRAALLTPTASLAAPGSMSIPTTHVVTKGSRTSLAVSGSMVTPMAQVLEEVSADGADRYGVSPQPLPLTTTGEVNRAALLTPSASLAAPGSMLTPSIHAVTRGSRTSLAVTASMVTPTAQVMEVVSVDGTDRTGASMQPSPLTIPAVEMMKKASTEEYLRPGAYGVRGAGPPTSSQMMQKIPSVKISQHSDKPSRIGIIREESVHSSLLVTIDGSDHSASMDRDDWREKKRGQMMDVDQRSNLRVQMKSTESVDARSVPKSGTSQEIDGSEGDRAENKLEVISGHEKIEIEDKKEMNDEREREGIVVREMMDGGERGGDVATDGEKGDEKIRPEGEVGVRIEDGGSVGNGKIAGREASLVNDNVQLEIREIRESGERLEGEAIPGGVLCDAGDSLKNVDDGRNKCPVTSKLSSCICHALRRWPRMTRKEYQESKEAITKIPTPTHKSRKIPGSKTVSSATVDTIEIQTNVERLNEIPRVTSDASSDMCDPCECDPCASVSSTSSEPDPIESRIRTVETRDQGVMAKIYKPRR